MAPYLYPFDIFMEMKNCSKNYYLFTCHRNAIRKEQYRSCSCRFASVWGFCVCVCVCAREYALFAQLEQPAICIRAYFFIFLFLLSFLSIHRSPSLSFALAGALLSGRFNLLESTTYCMSVMLHSQTISLLGANKFLFNVL